MSKSIPTSADPKSMRPVKKARGPSTASSEQSAAVNALFDKQLDRDIYIPSSATVGPKTAANLPPPPEIVANVQGSSAGAGSGEFHVYKASRRREYERIRLMEEESKREEADKAWQQKLEDSRRKDEEKTGKNAKKRAKMKARKEKAKTGDGNTGTTKSGLGPSTTRSTAADEQGEDAGGSNKTANTNDNMTQSGKETAKSNMLIIHDED